MSENPAPRHRSTTESFSHRTYKNSLQLKPERMNQASSGDDRMQCNTAVTCVVCNTSSAKADVTLVATPGGYITTEDEETIPVDCYTIEGEVYGIRFIAISYPTNESARRTQS